MFICHTYFLAFSASLGIFSFQIVNNYVLEKEIYIHCFTLMRSYNKYITQKMNRSRSSGQFTLRPPRTPTFPVISPDCCQAELSIHKQ